MKKRLNSTDMAEYKDVFGIGEKPAKSAPSKDERPSDALSFFGVPVEKKEGE